MNKFNNVINHFGNVTKTASALNVSIQAVCFWRDGKRNISAEKCSEIELVTNGEVTRKDLRPNDWHLVWPELSEKSA